MLVFDKVTVQFGGLTAVNELSFEVKENQIHSIIGPNGAGKTTVFNCISRFYKPTSGEISFEGANLNNYKPHRIVDLGIARSFQNVELFAKMSVIDNLLTGLHSVIKKNLFAAAFNLPSIRKSEKECIQKAEEVMEMIGISHLRDELVHNLPFGYQKMVDIGKAMMANPKLILLDEPVAGMNPVETARISELILRLKNELNYTVLVIEHDMSLVMKVSDYVTVVNFGKKIFQGTAKEVQVSPVVIEAYLGEVESDAEVI
ncbi:ABC transporter ATP-binding protein [Sporosarcina sp. CAU 1771]